jgi:hypothetical protein
MKKETHEALRQVEEELSRDGLLHPISEKDRKELLRGEKKMLISIYKKSGSYTLWTGFVIRIMYALHCFGITFSYIQSTCIGMAMATVVIISAVLSTCLIFDDEPVQRLENAVIHRLCPHHKAHKDTLIDYQRCPCTSHITILS